MNQNQTQNQQKLNNHNLICNTASAAIADSVPRNISKISQLLSFLSFGYKSPKTVVAVLRLSGVIGKVSNIKSGLSLESMNELIEKAFNLPKLTALCLIINSPGGSPVQSELIAKRIISLSKEKKIPVYSFIEDVAASGGYWLACAGTEIYASRSSIIGSIGVISTSFGFDKTIEKLGIERRVYSEGKNKSILDPFLPAKQSDIKIIQKLQQQIHSHFIDYVKERRIGKLTQSDDFLFNGEFWAGSSAVDFGLIDNIEDMYDFIKRKFGSEVKIEYVASKQSWLKKKFGMIQRETSQQFADHLIDSIEHKLMTNQFNLK
jgi:signal peptide peptidase SppA